MWADVEVEWDDRVDRATLHELAQRTLEGRRIELRRAVEELARAGERAKRARSAVLEASALVEDTCRLMAR